MAFVNSMLCPKAEVGFALPHGDWPCLIFHCNGMDAMPTGWCIQSGGVVRLSMLAPRKDRKGLAWPHPLMSHFDFQNKSCMEMKRLCQDPMDHTCTLPRSTRGNHSFWFVAFVKHVYTHGKSQRTTILSFLGSHEWLVLGSFLTCPCLR